MRISDWSSDVGSSDLLLDRDRGRSAAHIVREADSPWPARLQEMARRHGLWIHSGSMPLLAEDGARRVNRSHIVAADGRLRARSDKIHMFDVRADARGVGKGCGST